MEQFTRLFRTTNHYPNTDIACRESHKLKQHELVAGFHFHVRSSHRPHSLAKIAR